MFTMPAFIDTHAHFLGVGYTATLVDLTTADSVADVVSRLSRSTATKLIVGRGWNQERFTERRLPTKADLDRVSTIIPVVAVRVCGHVLVANSAMLALAGIGPEDVHRGPGTASFATGLFTEGAMARVYDAYPPPTPDDLARYFAAANRIFLSHGVTSVASDDFCVFPATPFETVLDVLEDCYANDLVQVRIVEQANLPTLAALERYVDGGFPQRRFGSYSSGPLKLLADGSLGGRTAFLRAPYTDDPTNRGVANFTTAELVERIRFADHHGMDVVIHAIGDAAADRCLDAFETALAGTWRPDRRHALVHAQMADHGAIARMRTLGIGAIVQPVFLESDLPMLAHRIGVRARESYLFGTMARTGIPLGFSTDAPVEAVDPFANLRLAVTRRSTRHPDAFLPEEAFSIADALAIAIDANRFYTYQDDNPDRVVLSEDPATLPPERLGEVRVLATQLDGRVVYRRA